MHIYKTNDMAVQNKLFYLYILFWHCSRSDCICRQMITNTKNAIMVFLQPRFAIKVLFQRNHNSHIMEIILFYGREKYDKSIFFNIKNGKKDKCIIFYLIIIYKKKLTNRKLYKSWWRKKWINVERFTYSFMSESLSNQFFFE